jgi:hypothetical protein
LEGYVDSIREPGHGTNAVNRRNIAHLRDQRDRAGLLQLADVLAAQTFPDAATLADEARAAAEWIDNTTPRTYDADDADDAAGIRPGDILRYELNGQQRQSVVIRTDGHTATTTHGDTIAI